MTRKYNGTENLKSLNPEGTNLWHGLSPMGSFYRELFQNDWLDSSSTLPTCYSNDKIAPYQLYLKSPLCLLSGTSPGGNQRDLARAKNAKKLADQNKGKKEDDGMSLEQRKQRYWNDNLTPQSISTIFLSLSSSRDADLMRAKQKKKEEAAAAAAASGAAKKWTPDDDIFVQRFK